jgi:hypothetical protein
VSVGLDVDPMTISEHEVSLVRDELEFLRTRVDDPSAQFRELRDIIDAFQFPRIYERLPITLLRKIVAQNVVSRCQALLYLQPVKQTDAEALDKRIIEKVHMALGFPFRPKTSIATLPVTLHGFGFPSLARINAGIALNRLARDLNHHILAYRSMAQITMMDWMCKKNGCVNPLDGEGLNRDFSHYSRSIPSEWITAQKLMKELSLSLQNVDQSKVAQGDVSLNYVLNSCRHHAPQYFENLNGTSLGHFKQRESAGWKMLVNGW